ncbi:DsrE/DsrF/DrsH-like family protein [Saccharicrinis fermentans]|uniref:Sulfurtransferase TusA n=1 Tax=Saccharicrinis fermentans DSM 9555 = JCM 21142 TaxID=869213 RepID=W7YMC4_9BACT|nr:DsrE/DsrF/DrsH-like family protein [Saccharicrinis fermentans]GAF03549.1 sulfurtransferase TusA [Saccharicrinis fermentans DSM 9555 = JCM 21142]
MDKRLDLLATVIKNNGTIYDLQEIEHAYAPPFSSAKDPVNQAGYNAENIIKGLFKPLSPFHFHKRVKQDVFVLDVRTSEEYVIDAIEDAVNIELDKLRANLDSIPRDKKIMIYCGVGLRGYVAARILKQNGFDEVYNLSGGLKVYNQTMAEQSNPIYFTSHEETNDAAKTVIPPINIKAMAVDACGLQCPGPVLKLKESIDSIAYGERLEVKATDPGFYNDVASWCKVTGHQLVKRENNAGEITAVIEKTKEDPKKSAHSTKRNDHKTMVVFSDDMDRALASFVIANGAASMGKKVTMFFTFWGLNVIKDAHRPRVKKDMMGSMFDKMMPGHAGKLKLSNMNMAGMGRRMMKLRMKDKNVDALETMIQQAQKSGIQMIACQMSMDIMGVQKEELIEGVTIGGVANYLEEAEQSNLNLFI